MAAQNTEPVGTRLPRNPLPAEVIERLFSRISEVSTLPTAAQQIVALTGDPSTGADDLLDAVRSDPALAMRVMRTVNSSVYGLSNAVGDLKQAITLIGFEEVRNLALTTYVSPLFSASSNYGPYSRAGLWSHMVGTAVVARQIAEITRKAPPQEAYLAGLLHDTGYILLDQYLHGPFCRVIDELDESAPTWQIELRLLGFDHAALGGYVATKWHFPACHAAAIRCHHLPETCDGDGHVMACIVAAADFFCHLKDLTSLGAHKPSPPAQEIFATLGLTRSDMNALLDQLDALLSAAQDVATIQIR
ncbi:MAG: HDOD domain-containing protein [Pirellulales bacterium]|nr:HDOD domain-containing protein [Pirellulales bacterium]